MRAILRAGFIGALMAAAPAFAQKGGAPAPVKDKLSSQENSPLIQARQEVSAARKKVDEDTGHLDSVKESAKAACEHPGPDCDQAQGVVAEGSKYVADDQKALDQARKNLAAVQHSMFNSGLSKRPQAESPAAKPGAGGTGQGAAGGSGRHRRHGGASGQTAQPAAPH